MAECVLITGGSGFIGSALVERLKGAGYRVLSIDLVKPRTYGVPDVFFQGDVRDLLLLQKITEEHTVTTILHLAAVHDVSIHEAEGDQAYLPNVEAIKSLTAVAGNCKFIRRFIFTSTQLVSELGHQPRTLTECRPKTHYGKSKLECEKMLGDWGSEDIDKVIVRPTNVWGPGMSAHYKKFLSYIVKGYYFHSSKKPLYKSYAYIDNVTFMLQKLMETDAEKVRGEVFYLADYEPMSLREYIDGLAEHLGAKKPVTIPTFLARMLALMGDALSKVGISFKFNSFRLRNILFEYFYDLSKTKDVCGTLPANVDAGIEATAKWYLEQSKQA
jgi:GlcNAc-P-P-Und epimerase